MKAGECMNLSGEFVCTESKAYMNYPCPYRCGEFTKCKCFIPATKAMEEKWDHDGVVTVSASDMPYDPLV